jgi:hypothetical protein
MDEPTVLVEETTQVSEPEATPVETPEEITETPASEEVVEPEKPTEERQSRSQERIREKIAEAKSAKEAAAQATQEAEYWKAQALANKVTAVEDDLEGVTDEGIDPKLFAKSLEAKVLQRVQEMQGLTAQQQKVMAEEYEVSSQPEMKDEFFRKQVLRTAKAEGLSPWEAFDSVKEELAEREKVQSDPKVRDEAGKFVRKETTTPATGRSSSGSESYFTRSQIDEMDSATYVKNIDEINKQLARGLIK